MGQNSSADWDAYQHCPASDALVTVSAMSRTMEALGSWMSSNRLRLNMYIYIQKIITRKLELFGHICRMDNDRKIKSIVFGRLDGTNKRGRPHTEWMDNITDWCGA